MRFGKFAVSASLVAGIVAIGGRAQAADPPAPILNNVYDVLSSSEPNTNICQIGSGGTNFLVGGSVRGAGTAGDSVMVAYHGPLPTNASRNRVKINVKQASFASLDVFISGSTSGNNGDTGSIVIEHCSVSGSVNGSTMSGSVLASCSGSNLFGGLTANQAASVHAAFNASKTVSFKVTSSGKWTLKIKCSGTASVSP